MRPGITGISILTLLLLSTLPSTILGADQDTWTIERFSWSGVLADQAPVKVTNRYGDLRFRGGQGREVEISALIQEDERDLHQADIQVQNSAKGLIVEVKYGEGQTADSELPENLVRRVDLVMFLPPGVQLQAETDRGLLEAKGLSSPIEAQTNFGDIVFSTTGPVQLSSQHGTVSGVFKTTQWPAPSNVETLTGDIRIELPQDADVEVHATTTGEITTDYSVEIERSRGFRKQAQAKIGSGKNQLRVQTDKGAVKLVESPF